MIRTPSSSAARLAAKAEDDFSRTPSRPGSASWPMSATRRRIADSLEFSSEKSGGRKLFRLVDLFSDDLGSSKKNIVSPMKLTAEVPYYSETEQLPGACLYLLEFENRWRELAIWACDFNLEDGLPTQDNLITLLIQGLDFSSGWQN